VSRGTRSILRFQVWWARIPDEHAESPEFSDGDREAHPFLVLSNNQWTSSGLCIGIPGSSQQPKTARGWIQLSANQIPASGGDGTPISKDTYFFCDQLRVVATKRLQARAGRVTPLARPPIEEMVLKILGLVDGLVALGEVES